MRNAAENNGYTADRRRISGSDWALASITAIIIIGLVLLLAGCGGGKNVAGQPPEAGYPLHYLARDVSVGGAAFLEEAKKNHGHQCQALCDPAKEPSIKDANRCVNICNGITLAAALHSQLNLAIDAACGPEFAKLRRTTGENAACKLNPDPAMRAQHEAQLKSALDGYRKAEADLQTAKTSKP